MQSPQINWRCVAWALQGRVATDTMARHTIDPPASEGMNRANAAPGAIPIQLIETVGASLLRMPVPRCQLPWIVLGPQPLPLGPGTPSRLSCLAMTRGEMPRA